MLHHFRFSVIGKSGKIFEGIEKFSRLLDTSGSALISEKYEDLI